MKVGEPAIRWSSPFGFYFTVMGHVSEQSGTTDRDISTRKRRNDPAKVVIFCLRRAIPRGRLGLSAVAAEPKKCVTGAVFLHRGDFPPNFNSGKISRR